MNENPKRQRSIDFDVDVVSSGETFNLIEELQRFFTFNLDSLIWQSPDSITKCSINIAKMFKLIGNAPSLDSLEDIDAFSTDAKETVFEFCNFFLQCMGIDGRVKPAKFFECATHVVARFAAVAQIFKSAGRFNELHDCDFGRIVASGMTGYIEDSYSSFSMRSSFVLKFIPSYEHDANSLQMAARQERLLS